MIKFSRHALYQMRERGISIQEAKDGITRGAKQIQYPDKLLYHYRYYTVVTKKFKDDILVITIKPRW